MARCSKPARNNGLGVARQRQDFYTKPPPWCATSSAHPPAGPSYIPNVYNGKNRTFFFFAWEAFRNAQASTVSANYPTAAMRHGDFSGLVDGTGRLLTLYDPWTTDSKTWQRQPFPGNVIPISKESPVAKYMWGVTELPTMPNVNPLIGKRFSALMVSRGATTPRRYAWTTASPSAIRSLSATTSGTETSPICRMPSTRPPWTARPERGFGWRPRTTVSSPGFTPSRRGFARRWFPG